MELEFIGRKKDNASHQSIKKRIWEIVSDFSAVKLLYYIFVFFISAARLPGGALPFGCAVFAAEYAAHAPLLVGVLVLLSGFMPPFYPTSLLKTGLALLLFSAAAVKTEFKKTPLFKGAAMALCTLFCSLVPKLFSAVFLYDSLLLLLESISVFVCTLLFSKARDTIFTVRRTPLSNEEIASLTVFAAAAVFGISGFKISGISAAPFFCALICLLFSYKNGAGAGAGAGVVLGIVSGLSSGNAAYSVAALSFSSMLCGFFAGYGKASCALSFLFAAALSTLLSPSASMGFINLTQTSLAAIVFILTPKKITSFFALSSRDSDSYNTHFKHYVSRHFLDSAQTIGDISDIFASLCHSSAAGESAASSFFERTTHRLCSGCAQKNHCWKSEFHRTYSSFFVLLEICNKQGSISFCDIPENLVKNCSKTGLIVSTFNSMYDLYKVDKLWECRILESRSMVSRQLKCISESLAQKAEGIFSEISFCCDAEDKLHRRLMHHDIIAENIFVSVKKGGSCRVDIDFDKNTNISCEKLEEIVSKTLGESFKCIYFGETGAALSRFPARRISCFTAGKAKSGNTQSGDSAASVPLENGRQMLLLSDGMGCGERASCDSRAAAALAEKMLKNGFATTSAIEIINSALVLKSSETSFASIDMAVIDLAAMQADFYKMGAAPAFIKRGASVKTIYAATLPAGTFSKSDIGHISQSLSSGDAVILVSDGIANGENTSEIEALISKYSGNSAEDFANRILSYAASKDKDISDDMTVMVAFIA